MAKYRWDYTLKQVVEFVKKDAEVAINIDGDHMQLVISRNHDSIEKAEEDAIDFCKQLDKKIRALITEETKHLTKAKP